MIVPILVKQFLEWHQEGSLNLMPEFQRRPIWPPKAKKFFIDTLLRSFPSPLIYMRPRIDQDAKAGIRDVVDGQQRLRAIIEFHNNELRLDEQTGEFSDHTFEELDPVAQDHFLYYELGVEELLNASDDYVLSVFQRINNFGLKLNSQEARHAKYVQGGKFKGGEYEGVFRQTVIDTSKRWAFLWTEHKVVSLAGRARMDDDQLTAQMLGVVLEGVRDGGQPYIGNLYHTYDRGISRVTINQLDGAIQYIVENFAKVLVDRMLRGAPHFLMLFAAVAHALHEIPAGDMGTNKIPALPKRDPLALSEPDIAVTNLLRLAEIRRTPLDLVPQKFMAFRIASAGTVQRIPSRAARFVQLYKALLPRAL